MLHLQSAASYWFTSTGMVFLNKNLMKSWSFNLPFFLVFAEMLFNTVSILTLSKAGLIQVKSADRLKHFLKPRCFLSTLKFFRYQIITSMFYWIHSVSALKALNGLSVPMYIILKRSGPFINFVISLFLFKKKRPQSMAKICNSKINLSIFAMTAGVIVAGFGDLKFDMAGYFYCALSVVCKALSLSFVQKCSEYEKGDSSIQTFCLSSFFTLPFLFFFFITSDEAAAMLLFFSAPDVYESAGFWFNLSLVVLIGCSLTFSQFWCTSNNSAITTSVIGVLKSVIQTLIGIFLFDSYISLSFLAYFGISINLIFGAYYTYLKYVEKEPNFDSIKSRQFDEDLV